ncbi:hypothetical protein B0H66DRAFT_590747 [Apodospora peruviana]|uniref:Uncharacterized protein n=1 Tax=Apodospora peruviana TaxID=516989 RepID=A0AAE0M436_9PEZI|nr:hypothetical protein B0H66DRAFT_590747 [Apodospora peruviana]
MSKRIDGLLDRVPGTGGRDGSGGGGGYGRGGHGCGGRGGFGGPVHFGPDLPNLANMPIFDGGPAAYAVEPIRPSNQGGAGPSGYRPPCPPSVQSYHSGDTWYSDTRNRDTPTSSRSTLNLNTTYGGAEEDCEGCGSSVVVEREEWVTKIPKCGSVVAMGTYGTYTACRLPVGIVAVWGSTGIPSSYLIAEGLGATCAMGKT